MKKLTYWAGAVAITANLAAPFVASSIASATSHATYALGTAKKCKTDFVKRTEKHVITVKVKGKFERESVRYVACVWYDPAPVSSTSPTVAATAPATAATSVTPTTTPTSSAPAGNSGSTSSTAPVVTTTTTTLAPTPTPNLAVSLDPTFVQGNTPSSYLSATYSFSASASEQGAPLQSLPSGVLNFYSDGLLTCSINVGGATSSGQCPVTYSTYGTHTAVTEYVSGTNSATTGTQNESIQPPPITVNDTFGSTSPTNVITGAIQATGNNAAVTVTDSNWEGAATVGLSDNFGDTCTASISGTQATCSMPITGNPTSLTVNYTGGTPAQSTQNLAPNGVQSVTTDWPAVSGIMLSGASLTVQVNTATVAWSNWVVQSSGAGPNNPPNPINVTTGKYVHLFVTTTGNVYPDSSVCDFGSSEANSEPCGYLVFTITGGTEGTDYTAINVDTGSTDCSEVQNYSGQAEGGCDLTFSTAGTYYLSVEYIATNFDGNYANTKLATTEQINVTS